MKKLRKILVVIPACCCILGSFCSLSVARPRLQVMKHSSTQNMRMKSPARLIYMCPPGWLLFTGSFKPGQTTICERKNFNDTKPPGSFACPPGTKPFYAPEQVQAGCRP